MNKMHASSFHLKYQRGYHVDEKATVLFLGDSVLQQYVDPLSKALDLPSKKIDLATRGGCVLLKGADFIDKISDISCNSISEKLYRTQKKWDLVVISQDWSSYDSSVRNLGSDKGVEKWSQLLRNTLDHFSERSQNILILGDHLQVEGADKLKVSMSIDKKSYQKKISNLTARSNQI